MQRETGNHNPKVIETTCSTVFPITNVTVDEENIWNADDDVMNNKFNDVYNTVGYWRKSLFYYLPDLRADVLLKKLQDL